MVVFGGEIIGIINPIPPLLNTPIEYGRNGRNFPVQRNMVSLNGAVKCMNGGDGILFCKKFHGNAETT